MIVQYMQSSLSSLAYVLPSEQLVWLYFSSQIHHFFLFLREPGWDVLAEQPQTGTCLADNVYHTWLGVRTLVNQVDEHWPDPTAAAATAQVSPGPD